MAIIAGMCWKNFDSVSIRFGLDPVSRSRLKTGVPEDESDPLLELLKRREAMN